MSRDTEWSRGGKRITIGRSWPGRKRPILMVGIDNVTSRVVATFNSEDAANVFADVLTAMSNAQPGCINEGCGKVARLGERYCSGACEAEARGDSRG